MNRRRYLAAVAAAPLAGCLDRIGAAGRSPRTVPDAAQRIVRLAAADEAPADGVTIEVAVVEPAVTPDHPARVTVTTTNEGRERDLSVAPGRCCLFNRSGGASDPAGLWLHRRARSEGIDREGDRWTRDAPADTGRAFYMYGCLPRTFAAGESVATEYAVWDDYRADGYYEPGRYRVAEPVTVGEPDGNGPIATFDWGFSVRVERP